MRVKTNNIVEAVSRFEGLRRVLLHRCGLEPHEIWRIKSLADYESALMDAASGERGQLTDFDGIMFPVLPEFIRGERIRIVQHTSCTSNTLIRLWVPVASDGYELEDPTYHVELWRAPGAPPLDKDIPRDAGLLWCMSDEFVFDFDRGWVWPSLLYGTWALLRHGFDRFQSPLCRG